VTWSRRTSVLTIMSQSFLNLKRTCPLWFRRFSTTTLIRGRLKAKKISLLTTNSNAVFLSSWTPLDLQIFFRTTQPNKRSRTLSHRLKNSCTILNESCLISRLKTSWLGIWNPRLTLIWSDSLRGRTSWRFKRSISTLISSYKWSRSKKKKTSWNTKNSSRWFGS